MSTAQRSVDRTVARDSGAYPAAGYAWYVVAILFLAYVVSFLDRQILSLMVDPIRNDLQVSDTVMGLLQGLTFAVFYTVCGIPLGRLADNRNRKGIIMAGISLWSLMTALCGFAQSALTLFAARVGVGVGEASLSPSAYSLISDYFPRDQRGRATSVYSLGIFAGAGVAFIFGGLIFELAALAEGVPVLGALRPWQLTFLFASLPGLLVVVLMLSVREASRKERLGGTSVPIAEVVRYLSDHWRVYTGLLVGVGFVSMAAYGLFSWLPTYFIRVHSYSAGQIGLAFGSILLVSGTAGLVLAGLFADIGYRRGRLGAHWSVMTVMTALTFVPAAALFFVGDDRIALACVAVMVFALAAHTGLVPTCIQLITPNELRGQIVAVYLLWTSIVGLGGSSLIVALITDRVFGDDLAVGQSLAITQCAAIAIGTALFAFGYRAYVARQEAL